MRLEAALRGNQTVVVAASGHVPYAARTVPGDDGWARVVLVQTVAGPLGGDQTTVELAVGPGAALEVATNAATIAYPGSTQAAIAVTATVAAGGRLAWLPSSLILTAGCDLHASLELRLESDARAIVREVVLLGRHAEGPGRYTGRLRCVHRGVPLLHDEVEIDDDGLGHASPSVLGPATAYGSLALLGAVTAAEAAVDELQLEGPGRLVRVLARGAASLDVDLARAEAAYREAIGLGGADTHRAEAAA